MHRNVSQYYARRIKFSNDALGYDHDNSEYRATVKRNPCVPEVHGVAVDPTGNPINVSSAVIAIQCVDRAQPKVEQDLNVLNNLDSSATPEEIVNTCSSNNMDCIKEIHNADVDPAGNLRTAEKETQISKAIKAAEPALEETAQQVKEPRDQRAIHEVSDTIAEALAQALAISYPGTLSEADNQMTDSFALLRRMQLFYYLAYPENLVVQCMSKDIMNNIEKLAQFIDDYKDKLSVNAGVLDWARAVVFSSFTWDMSRVGLPGYLTIKVLRLASDIMNKVNHLVEDNADDDSYNQTLRIIDEDHQKMLAEMSDSEVVSSQVSDVDQAFHKAFGHLFSSSTIQHHAAVVSLPALSISNNPTIWINYINFVDKVRNKVQQEATEGQTTGWKGDIGFNPQLGFNNQTKAMAARLASYKDSRFRRGNLVSSEVQAVVPDTPPVKDKEIKFVDDNSPRGMIANYLVEILFRCLTASTSLEMRNRDTMALPVFSVRNGITYTQIINNPEVLLEQLTSARGSVKPLVDVNTDTAASLYEVAKIRNKNNVVFNLIMNDVRPMIAELMLKGKSVNPAEDDKQFKLMLRDAYYLAVFSRVTRVNPAADTKTANLQAKYVANRASVCKVLIERLKDFLARHVN